MFTLILLVGTLFTGGLHLGNLYYFHRVPFPELVANSLLYLAVLGLLVTTAGYPLLTLIPSLARGGPWLKLIFMGCVLGECAALIYVYLFVAADRLTEYALFRVIRRALFFLLVLAAWLLWPPSLELVLGFYGIAFFLVLLASLLFWGGSLPWQEEPLRPSWTSLGKCLGYGLWAQALVSVDMAGQRLGAIFLGLWTSPDQNGLFSVALNFGQAIWALVGVLGVVVQSGGGSSFEEQLANLGKLSRHALVLMVLGGATLALLARPLLAYGYGPEFMGSLPLLWIIIPGFVAYALYTLVSSFMIANGWAGAALGASLAGLLANVLLCRLYIPTQGSVGAAKALTWGFMASTLALLVITRLSYKIAVKPLLLIKKQELLIVLRGIKKIVAS